MENSNRHNLTKYSYLNQNNEEIEYFIGAEIAILLGYKNNTQAIQLNVSQVNKINFKNYLGIKEPKINSRQILINKNGIKELINKNNKTISQEIIDILKEINIIITPDEEDVEEDVEDVEEDEEDKNSILKDDLTTYEYISNGLYFEYFIGYEVAALLGYKNTKDVIIKNVSKSNQILFNDYPGVKKPKLQHNTILITRDGAIEILLKTRKRISPDVLHILKKFNIDTTNRKCLTKEQQTLSTITNVFKTEKFEDQFKIGSYYLDLFFTDYKIVIECDENGHADRKPWKERERMDFVNKKLSINDSNWIRFNPDEYEFDIAKVIGRIYRKIDEIKQEEIEIEVKRREDEIKKNIKNREEEVEKEVKKREEEFQKLLEEKKDIIKDDTNIHFNIYSHIESGIYTEYFVAVEITDILGYKSVCDPLNLLVSDCNKISFKDFKGEKNPLIRKNQALVTRKGVIEILLKTRKVISPSILNLFKTYKFEITIRNNKKTVEDIKLHQGKECYKEKKEMEEDISEYEENAKQLNIYSYKDSNGLCMEYFVGNEISNLLGYNEINSTRILTSDNNFLKFADYPGEKYPKLYPHALLINREGVKDILMKTTKYLSPFIIDILRKSKFNVKIEGGEKIIDKYFEDNSEDIRLDTLIVDNKLINNIKDALRSEKCIEQYEIEIKSKDNYKLELYFPEYKIIVDNDSDKKRFLSINNFLKIDESYWVRYDSDIGKTIKQIVEIMKVKGKVIYQTCCSCKVSKELSEYHQNLLNPLKVEYCCKVCRSEKNKERIRKKRKVLEELKITEKYCGKCETTMEISNFWKTINATKDGHNKYCKKCAKEENKIEKIKKEIPNEKECIKCKITKSKNEFSRNFGSEDGLNETCVKCYKYNRSKTI